MGKVAIADEQLWTYCKQYNPAKGYVIGLILGQSSKAGYHVVHLARIPPADNASKGKDSSAGGDEPVEGLQLPNIKEAWVATQACDVTRMLPGGMWVLGLFLIGPDDPFENQQSTSRLRAILRYVQGELKKNPSLCGDSPSEKLLLHLNVQKNIFTCKNVDLDGSAAFRPAEWKFQKNPVVWTQIDSILDLNFVKHLTKEESSKPLKNQLQVILNTMSKRINESVCMLSNDLLDPDDLVESIFKKRKAKGSKKSKGSGENDPKSITANLYLPMTEDVESSPGVELSQGRGIMYFIGGPVSRVFIHQKTTFEEACKAVKEDFIRSLAARLQMHSDSLVEEEPSPSEDLETVHEPPRRVMINLPFTNVTFSDYLFPGEGPEEALLSSEDLLDLKLQLENVETDIESATEIGATDQQWSSEQPEDIKGLELAASAEKSSYIIFIVLGAVLFALLAFVVHQLAHG